MLVSPERVAVGVAVLVALAGVTGAVVATRTTGSTVTFNPSPGDPDINDATHAVVLTVGPGISDDNLSKVRIKYGGSSGVDASDTGQENVERIGIDRGGDNVGTRIDEEAVVDTNFDAGTSEVNIPTGENLTAPSAGDEVVVVLDKVANPTSEVENASVNVTINPEQAAESAGTTVDFVYNRANVTFENQTTTGESVTVASANLSEGGWVAISNGSNANSDGILGATYLDSGDHSDVEVPLDESVSDGQTVYAQAHLDTNGNRRFDYNESGGERDELYRTSEDNIQTDGSGGGSATVTKEEESTPTPTPTPTSTPAPTSTPMPADTPTDGSDSGDSDDSNDGDDGSAVTPTPTATSTPMPTPTPTPDSAAGSDGTGGTGDDGTAGGGSSDSNDGDTTDGGSGDGGTPTPTPTPAGGTDTPTETGSSSPEIGGLGNASLAVLPLLALVLLVGGLYAVFGRRERE